MGGWVTVCRHDQVIKKDLSGPVTAFGGSHSTAAARPQVYVPVSARSPPVFVGAEGLQLENGSLMRAFRLLPKSQPTCALDHIHRIHAAHDLGGNILDTGTSANFVDCGVGGDTVPCQGCLIQFKYPSKPVPPYQEARAAK